MLNRQVALINDQTDIWDALAEVKETEAPAEEPTTDPNGDLVLFVIPAAPTPALVAEQLVIDLAGGERLEQHGPVTYAVRVDDEGLACYRPVA